MHHIYLLDIFHHYVSLRSSQKKNTVDEVETFPYLYLRENINSFCVSQTRGSGCLSPRDGKFVGLTST